MIIIELNTKRIPINDIIQYVSINIKVKGSEFKSIIQ